MNKSITIVGVAAALVFANGSVAPVEGQVTIGTQTWMTTNMGVLPSKGESWCAGSLPANCEKYGRLYSWDAAQVVCPTGWHLPTLKEWEVLVKKAGGKDKGGRALRAKGAWPVTPGVLSTDKFGFAVLPGGYYNVGWFDRVGDFANFWTSTTCRGDNAWYVGIGYNKDVVYMDPSNLTPGFSVRCIKDRK